MNVKKLSVSKCILENFADPLTASGHLFARILKFKPIPTTFGTSLKLTGNFRLLVPNKDDPKKNDVYESNTAYVPGAVEDAIQVALAGIDPTSFKGVDFAARIFTRENKKSVTKYEWAFESLVEADENADPLAQLMDKAGFKGQLQLENSSKKDSTPATKPTKK